MQTAAITVDGVGVQVVRAGKGRPIVFFHSVGGIDTQGAFLEGLAERGSLIAPWHPGFGHSELPGDYRSVGDLALFYLDFLEHEGVQDALVVGQSFGAWLAAEVAVRDSSRFERLVLISPVGIKVGDRETRDIADVFAMSQDELAEAAYFDPAKRTRDYSAMSDDELTAIARSRQSYAYFGWQPYMHNPTLRRWLHRIRQPVLVIGGTYDGLLRPGYLEGFVDALPHARLHRVAQAGHYPDVEQPGAVLELIDHFVGEEQ